MIRIETFTLITALFFGACSSGSSAEGVGMDIEIRGEEIVVNLQSSLAVDFNFKDQTILGQSSSDGELVANLKDERGAALYRCAYVDDKRGAREFLLPASGLVSISIDKEILEEIYCLNNTIYTATFELKSETFGSMGSVDLKVTP